MLNQPKPVLSKPFDDYVRARRAWLIALATFLCSGDRAAGEDLVQDVLASSYAKWSSINPAAREAYLRRGLVRAAGRWRRRRSLAVLVDPMALQHLQTPVEPSPAESLSGIDLAPYLQELSRRQRAVVVLRYSEDLDDATIADLLGCSTGAVKSHGARALDKLRRHLMSREGNNDED